MPKQNTRRHDKTKNEKHSLLEPPVQKSGTEGGGQPRDRTVGGHDRGSGRDMGDPGKCSGSTAGRVSQGAESVCSGVVPLLRVSLPSNRRCRQGHPPLPKSRHPQPPPPPPGS